MCGALHYTLGGQTQDESRQNFIAVYSTSTHTRGLQLIQLEAIEIYYFRSIYSLKIKNLKDLSVLSGKNDCGKSNVLKALNLFFNNETDWQNPLDFSRDFSNRRLEEVRKETVKGKQFIRVRLKFLRGNRSERSLPEKFEVTKTWYRDTPMPEVKSSIEGQFKSGQIKAQSLDRAKAGLQKYLNRIRFEYVPAIKDRSFFSYLLGLLQDTILEKKSAESRIVESVIALNEAVDEGALFLNSEFEQVCGVKTNIRLPQELAVLFRAFSVETKSGNADMPLIMRGDGIQTRFVPSLLHYIAVNSSLTYVWGFEEPENCLEHSLATELSTELQGAYSKDSQIFLTSHSPAFIGLRDINVSAFRVFSKTDSTAVLPLDSPENDSDDMRDLLKDELGLLQLTREQQGEFERRKKELESEVQHLKDLKIESSRAQSPILLTEGPSDPMILNEAWKRLYPHKVMEFRIISCNTFTDKENAAGTGMLTKALESCRSDQPLTIGLFDRDWEGMKAFKKLGGMFHVFQGNPLVKIHKNKNVAAFLIPDIDGKEDYIEAENLPIEFLFPEDCITKQQNGFGLKLRQVKKTTKVDQRIIGEVETNEPYHRKIDGNKVHYAEKIISTFPDSAFNNFEKIFECFQLSLSHMSKM